MRFVMRFFCDVGPTDWKSAGGADAPRGAILHAVKTWSRVRWWEWTLIMAAAMYPAMRISRDMPTRGRYLAYGVAAILAVFITGGLDQRRRRRAYEEAERREPPHPPGSTCCSPRSRDA